MSDTMDVAVTHNTSVERNVDTPTEEMHDSKPAQTAKAERKHRNTHK